MDKLKELLSKVSLRWVASGVAVLGASFSGPWVLQLIQALSDGQLSDAEVHLLLSSASGVEFAVIVALVLLLKR